MRESLRYVTLGVALLMGGVVLAVEPAPSPAAAAEKKGTINLQLEGVGADEAFDQLAKQAGVDLMVQDQQLWANADPVDIQVTNGYFWPTFLDMCKQARIGFSPHYGEGRSIMLNRASGQGDGMGKAPSSVSEGNVVRATYANRTASVNYDNPGNASSQFSVQFSVLMDPALATVGYMQVTATEAIDDQGNSLLPPQRDGGTMYGGNQNTLVGQAGVNLLCPANVGKKLTRLKGYVRTSAATKYELVEIDKPLTAEPVKKETAEHEITIMPLKKTGQGDQKNYELKVTFRAKERQAGGLRRQQQDPWGMMNKIEIRDADGKRFGNGGGGGGGGGDVMEYTLNIHGSGRGGQIGEPAKLIWRLPTEIREVRIPFEFTDLAIPQI